MITIIADRHRYATPPEGALHAGGLLDYVPVRQRIRAALDQGAALTVYVTDPVVLGWLTDLQRYPERRVTWRVVDPREEFAQIFGTAPVDPFTPARIASLRLDHLPHPPAGIAVQPLTWILGHRLDPIWQYDEPPPGHAAQLAAWALQHTEPLDGDFAPLVQAQLDRWALHVPIYRELRAVSLSDDGANLLICWALQRYDEIWRRTQPWGGLQKFADEPPLSAVVTALNSQHQAIQAYWSRQITGATIGSEMIATALGQMAGLSVAELSALTAMLQRCSDVLDSHLLEAIQHRFAHLPAAEQTLRRLTEKTAPPIPSLPEPEWSVEEWLNWATQQYMPYFAWVIRNDKGREHQQECALRYSDWLYAQYPAWLNDERSPLLLSQYQHMCRLIEQDERAVVVWLIIDGLTWWQGDLMREACERHGLHLQALRSGIAVLPSITSISKRALVTGQPTIDLVQPIIAEAARVKLARSNLHATVSYDLTAAVTELQQNDDLRVAVVLFNTIDALAHQTSTFTDNVGIYGYLDELARELDTARQVCIAQGRRLHVLIGSDHGSTLLPTSAVSLPLPSAAHEIDDVWEPELTIQEALRPGTRAAAIDLEHIPAIDHRVWYTLDRDRFQLDRHYLSPRGYGYIKRRPPGWTHGGLTPEETIVPLIHLALECPTLIAIEVMFQGTLRAGQSGSITAVLRNLNPFPVQNLSLIVSGGADEVKIAQMNAFEQQEVQLRFAAVMTQGSELPIVYILRYNVFGNLQQVEGQAHIALRRLQTEDASFDDLFN